MPLPLPTRRMLAEREAADYCGFTSAANFRARVRVAPVNYGKTLRWDRHRLDEWLDSLTAAGANNDDSIIGAAGHEDGAHPGH